MGVLFGMGLLFLVAGLFTPVSLRRKGAGRFALDRLLRLGIPLVVFVFVLDPLTDFMGYRGMGEGDTGFIDYLARWWREDSDLGPMWFVATLLLFSLIYAAWRRLRPAPAPAAGRLTWGHLAGTAGAIASLTFLVRLEWPFLSQSMFGLNLWEFPQMGALFILGALAAERGWLADALTDRMRRACGWATIAGLAVMLAVLAAIDPTDPDVSFTGGLRWQALALPVVEATVAVGMSLWALEWFRRRWHQAGRLARALGRASYAAYILHPPVVVAGSLAVRSAPIPVEAKFLVVAAAGTFASFALGWLATRPGLLARIL